MRRRGTTWLVAAVVSTAMTASALASAVAPPPTVPLAAATSPTTIERALGAAAGPGDPKPAVSPPSGQRTVVLDGQNHPFEIPQAGEGPPHWDPAFIEQVPGAPCTAESEYEWEYAKSVAAYGSACKRIRFALGPIPVRPGQNTAVLMPVTIE